MKEITKEKTKVETIVEKWKRQKRKKQVRSDNDASEVGILGHIGTFWDILGHFGTIPKTF